MEKTDDADIGAKIYSKMELLDINYLLELAYYKGLKISFSSNK